MVRLQMISKLMHIKCCHFVLIKKVEEITRKLCAFQVNSIKRFSVNAFQKWNKSNLHVIQYYSGEKEFFCESPLNTEQLVEPVN